MTQPTETQARIAELAERMAAANADAAAELGAALVAAAARAKRPRGLCVLIRWNSITERIEIATGGTSPTAPAQPPV